MSRVFCIYLYFQISNKCIEIYGLLMSKELVQA